MSRFVKLVIFDFDGTIADSAVTVLEILNVLRYDLGRSALHICDIKPLLSVGGMSLIKQALGDEVDHENYLKKFRSMYLNHSLNNERLYPGVLEFIQNLIENNKLCAICSNKPQKLLEKSLVRHDLRDYFKFISADDGVIPKKPNPESLRSIISRAELAPDQVILIGDSAIDQQTANKAGIKFYFHKNGYNNGVFVDKTDFNFEKYSELKGVLT